MRAPTLLPLLVTVILLGVTPTVASGQANQGPVRFHVEELLFHPRADGVTLAMQTAEPAELLVEYGSLTAPGLHTLQRFARAGQRVQFELDGLWPDDEFLYRVSARRPHEREFRPRDVHDFRTTRSPGSTFSFAVLADTHAYAVWSKAVCADFVPPKLKASWVSLQEALGQIRDDDSLDFVVAGSDNVMTRCGGCVACDLPGFQTSQKDINSAQEARLRYRQTFGPEIYGVFGPERPMLYLFGDHDGEQGWVGACDLPAEMGLWSEAARRATLPSSEPVYGGDPDGRFFAVTSGDLLLVQLDPLSKTTGDLQTPEDFTLGARQFAWLERTLEESDATFKVVMAERLLGGITTPELPCYKSRGGIRSTHDGMPTGTFLGEQALLQQLFVEHGVQLYLSFHDHVAAIGEKLDATGFGTGVVYAIGGRVSGVGHPWADEEWYREALDYDLDGIPEYDTGLTGTREPGYFEITVEGDQRLTLVYRSSDLAVGGVGAELLRFEIPAVGGFVIPGNAPTR